MVKNYIFTPEIIQELQRLLNDNKRIQLDYNKRDSILKISECTPKKVKIVKLQEVKKMIIYVKGDKSDLLDLCHKSACSLYNLKKYSKIILEKKIILTFLADKEV